jgi:hypothetical protein
MNRRALCKPPTDGMRAYGRAAGALLFVGALVAGCAPPPDERVAYAPVLQVCEELVRQRISGIPESSDYSARLRRFDAGLSSHPGAVGFVEVRSESDDEERLAMLAGGLIRDCDTNMSMSYRKDSPEDARALFEFLTQVSEGRVFFNDRDRGGAPDPAHVYLVDSGGSVKVFFRVDYE